ncbi:MAG: hypothetical protein ACNS60_13380 [Candidatus Cyclobacteriaceae bacterium M2_1C_046]
MNKKKDKYGGLYIIGFLILLTIGLIYYKYYLRDLPQNYTIGKIIKIWKPVKGGTVVSYSYTVNGEEYEGSVKLHPYEDVAKPNKIFLVEYPENYENEGVMLLDFPINDNIQPPITGWDKKPNINN